MQAAGAKFLAPSYFVRTNGNIGTFLQEGITMRAVGIRQSLRQ